VQNPEAMERLVNERVRDFAREAHRRHMTLRATSGRRPLRERLATSRAATSLTRLSLAYHIIFKASANCLGEVGSVLHGPSQPSNENSW
jgi:hypothetical protein